MSTTAWVSAALPDRHAHTYSWIGTILSLTRFATYDPDDVRESAPSTTPPSNVTAMIVVCVFLQGKVGGEGT